MTTIAPEPDDRDDLEYRSAFRDHELARLRRALRRGQRRPSAGFPCGFCGSMDIATRDNTPSRGELGCGHNACPWAYQTGGAA